ncbi:MAG: tetratricopeptide repeat protein [Thermoanaerobaculia bacterium]|nr:tetratricopeptide repeat protein [Thermoanaerobaculia bacterium]
MRNILTSTLLGFVAMTSAMASNPPENVQLAIDQQRVLIAATPHQANAHNDLGNLLLLTGDVDAAEAEYREATRLDDRLISAHFNLGLLLAQRGQLDQATEEFERVVEQDDEHAWAYFQLGRLHELAGRERRALEAYTRSFRLDPALTFADVNPQILDSQLTTRALLGLDAGKASAQEAPRVYEDPYRIATLLLPKLPTEDTRAASQEVDDDEARASREYAQPGTLQDDESSQSTPRPQSDQGKRATTTLSSGDLDRGSRLGEADPLAADTRRPAPQRDARRLPPSASGRDTGVPSGHIGANSPRRSTGQVGTRLVPNGF